MEILSYPVGLLIGLFPIAVALGPTAAPAHLLLDSRPVCELSVTSPGCVVDLGPGPRIHLLELIRTDAAGRVTERVGRWVNRPGIQPEIQASGGCDEETRDCKFTLTWAHPGKLDPKELVLQLDGQPVYRGRTHVVRMRLSDNAAPPQILVVDAEFPDGRRASTTRTLIAFNPEEASAAMQAVPIVPAGEKRTDEALTMSLRAAGWPVRLVEEGEPEIVFVIEPAALDLIPRFFQKASRDSDVYAAIPRRLSHIRVINADPNLTAFDSSFSQSGWLYNLAIAPRVVAAPTVWLADAVAVGGYELGQSPRRRMLVLVVSGRHAESSLFSPRQAQEYLAEAMVPLTVWRVGLPQGLPWPEGPRLNTVGDFVGAAKQLRAALDRQRVAWLEGSRDLRHTSRILAPGIALAGRTGDLAPAAPPAPLAAPARARSAGPDGGPVHRVALSGDGALAYAGTHAGVFRSRDRGEHWESASDGLPPAPVRALAIDPSAPETACAGTDRGIFMTRDAGGRWVAGGGAIAGLPVAAVAVAAPRTVYAGTGGLGVHKSVDGGATFAPTALGFGDVRALAVDAASATIYAALEDGVRRSADGGATWQETAPLPARALGLAVLPGPPGKLYAATAGAGLVESTDRGATWLASRLPAAFLTDVALAPAAILAASPDGVFASHDSGRSWKLARIGAVESLAAGAPDTLLSAGVSGIERSGDRGAKWSSSNAGLSASIVFDLARDPDSGALYAGTGAGLFHLDADGANAAIMPGTPAAPTYAVVFTGASPPELLAGAAGDIARSFSKGAGWSRLPTSSTYCLAVDPSTPTRLYAGTRSEVLRSDDAGLTWGPASAGIDRAFALDLAVDPRNPSTVYAATVGGGVFKSLDAGQSWKPSGPELKRTVVRRLAFEPADPETIYAATDKGVFASVNGGRSWKPRFEGLPRGPVYALLADPEAPGLLFAGTADGLFLSLNGGENWTAFPGPGIPAAVTTLSLDASRKALLVGTFGAGLFTVPLED